MEIRQDIYNLLIGYQETAYEKDALVFMVGRLENLESEYISLFSGIRKVTSEHYTFYYTPVAADEGHASPLMKFSYENGVVQSAGGDMLINFTSVDATENIPGQEISPGASGGYAYRIPGAAEVSITYGGREYFSSRETVNQFGALLRLPADVVRVSFDPGTGAVRDVLIQP